MTLSAYTHLTSQRPEALGIMLPAISQGQLTVTSMVLSYEQLVNEVDTFEPQHGWVMTKAKVQRAVALSVEPDLLEAEFSHADSSLHIRLESPGLYRCIRFSTEFSGDMLWRDQEVFARETNGSKLRYRLWWQKGAAGIDEGRYRPVAQQFIGFVSDTSAEAL